MQYKVPQNIDLEDKIVGPFTMRQFLYLLAGGAVIYVWWNYSITFVSPQPMVIFLPLAIPIGLIAFSFALVKVNDRPFEYFILSIFKFLFSPKQRRWTAGYQPEAVVILDKIAAQKEEKKERDVRDLDSLAKSLDRETSDLQSKLPQPKAESKPSEKPTSINLSVQDVQGATQKQQAAQANPEVKKGLFSIFKK